MHTRHVPLYDTWLNTCPHGPYSKRRGVAGYAASLRHGHFLASVAQRQSSRLLIGGSGFRNSPDVLLHSSVGESARLIIARSPVRSRVQLLRV